MLPGGRIAIVDFLVGDHTDPGIGALMDLNMLAMATGKERTLAEFDALLSNSGLRRLEVHQADSPHGLHRGGCRMRRLKST